jgi:hypothetical protein
MKCQQTCADQAHSKRLHILVGVNNGSQINLASINLRLQLWRNPVNRNVSASTQDMNVPSQCETLTQAGWQDQ